MRGDWAEGVTQSGRALALFQQTGDQAGQGWALATLGFCHAHLGKDDLARGYARQALEVTPEAGDPTTLAVAWGALGFVHSGLGEPRQAISCYRQALAFARERKFPMTRAILVGLLAGFGDACRAAGDLPAAVEAWQQALQILRDLGWPESRESAPGSSRPGRPARRADRQGPTPAVSRLALACDRAPVPVAMAPARRLRARHRGGIDRQYPAGQPGRGMVAEESCG